ncbi:MAG: YbaB/EbfC family nucleoid-associated protein [Actinomycetota bacterium]|nr:YbaB/EbfC family nucleoid-associated protein [Actinomycetota bacterium]
MNDDAPGFAELDERARQLSAEAQHLYSITKRRKEALRSAEERARSATGEAVSQDGSVHASVDAGGMLTGLVLTPAALRKSPGELASLVTEVTRQATARARADVRQVYESLRDEGVLRSVPSLLPEPDVRQPPRARREEHEEEASYEERSITRRRGRR